MSKHVKNAAFAPGEFLVDELEARGWSQKEFAEIVGRPHATVNQIAQGKKAITPETAREFAAALGTSAELWLSLQGAYDLAQVRADDGDIGRRAALHTAAPVAEMRRRGWISGARDVGRTEAAVLAFFGVRTLTEIPGSLQAAPRRSTSTVGLNPAQAAWCRRAKELAEGAKVAAYTPERLRTSLPALRAAAVVPERAAEVAELLAAAGVRFVVVRHLAGTRMDGAAMWLGRNKPLVALSLRFDRIDYFWFTLGHELGHLLHGDAKDFCDDDLARGEDEEPESVHANPAAVERKADDFAAQWLVPKDALASFVARARGRFDRRTIIALAAEVGVHPGIVAGRLQWSGLVRYAAYRDMLAKVRSSVLSRSIADGWD